MIQQLSVKIEAAQNSVSSTLLSLTNQPIVEANMAKKYFNISEIQFQPKSTHGLFKDLEGRTFGRLIVLGFAGIHSGDTFWYCQCVCGNIARINASGLANQTTQSCGCLGQERRVKAVSVAGGLSRSSRTYKIWAHMRHRCHYPKDINYQNYGGRGITVCPQWRASFNAFLADIGHPPTDKHSIDRIDNSKGYEPENCRWATRKEQANNTRRCRFITFADLTLTIKQWTELLGVSYTTVVARLNRGRSFVDAVTAPRYVRPKNSNGAQLAKKNLQPAG